VNNKDAGVQVKNSFARSYHTLLLSFLLVIGPTVASYALSWRYRFDRAMRIPRYISDKDQRDAHLKTHWIATPENGVKLL